jgi:hypothetical protein
MLYRNVIQIEFLSPKPMDRNMSLKDAVMEFNESGISSLSQVSKPVANQRINEKAFRIRAKKQGWKKSEVDEVLSLK